MQEKRKVKEEWEEILMGKEEEKKDRFKQNTKNNKSILNKNEYVATMWRKKVKRKK